MSAMANTTPLVTTVTKPATNPRDADATPRVNIQEFCEEYYEDILPIIMDKVRRDRQKDVHTRQSAFDRLSETYSPSKPNPDPVRQISGTIVGVEAVPHRLDTSNEDCPKDRERFCSIGESYDDSFSHSYRDGNRSRHMKRHWDNESPLSSVSKSDSSDGRVWFDELPPESIDSYKDLKAAFLAYFMQQKKYVKDPVEIQNIKQKDGETIEDFMERLKLETGRMKGALELAEHRLNIREGYSPVQQKKIGQAHERAKVIQAEVQKLVEAGIMREVYYHDWLSNPVMECYPLPEIDWKVKSVCGYPFKCFSDAYKGYHQIQLVEPDKEKTTFHTGQEVYCYTKMPFGLKNAGATYQRQMDKAFDSQIGRNIEVYVDDLVVKSYTEAEMLRDIDETFRTLRKINMKLNP
nr:reverse transcriptase domain-containing protein [Tanacetum cinerariifolium]